MTIRWAILGYMLIVTISSLVFGPDIQYVGGSGTSDPPDFEKGYTKAGDQAGEPEDFGEDEGEPEDFEDEEAETSDFAGSQPSNFTDGQRFPLNARMIAEELSSLSPVEIRNYPITDLSAEDLILVLGYLSPSNLAKVLLNISLASFLWTETMLSPAAFDETMNRLPVENRTLVENRLSLSPPDLIQ